MLTGGDELTSSIMMKIRRNVDVGMWAERLFEPFRGFGMSAASYSLVVSPASSESLTTPATLHIREEDTDNSQIPIRLENYIGRCQKWYRARHDFQD
ncbi:hypothetical protein KIN20_006459 [Parelaphostrongylus tenuis]|uniref:Uncharacterized protein n=1 Tax=Parelaphostrongylus tenuis TaxID=148309 RepID=A0AAD5MN09_PARTN|nr:hypothetical protein KIN20_006459 [Parelaphostrongylus tenuis]